MAQRIARRAQIVCLDEFLVADIADAMILGGLLDGLFRRGVTLVATSNLAPQDLYQDGLQRQRFVPAIELCNPMSKSCTWTAASTIGCASSSRRRPTWTPSSPGTPRRSRGALRGARRRQRDAPATLTIEGRPLRALATGPGMVWFEFGELCEGPRSQNDYIELARLYGTLFISNIPQFTPQHEDAARRFIMLIDELYDRGVKIVVSAAAAPAELYHGERLNREFERAASRLVEMQTQHYLAGRHRA